MKVFIKKQFSDIEQLKINSHNNILEQKRFRFLLYSKYYIYIVY